MRGATIMYISIYSNNRGLDDAYMKCNTAISKIKLLECYRSQILWIKILTTTLC